MKEVLGMKSGFLAALISGIVNTLLIIVVLFSSIININFSSMPTKEMIMILDVVLTFFLGIFIGTIGGLLFSMAYKDFPTNSNIVKGMLCSIPLWIIFRLGKGFIDLENYGTLYVILVHGVIGLIIWLIWGALLGYFWDRFEPKDVDNEI